MNRFGMLARQKITKNTEKTKGNVGKTGSKQHILVICHLFNTQRTLNKQAIIVCQHCKSIGYYFIFTHSFPKQGQKLLSINNNDKQRNNQTGYRHSLNKEILGALILKKHFNKLQKIGNKCFIIKKD